MKYTIRNPFLTGLILLFAVGCTQVKKIITGSTPREKFSEALKNSPLEDKSFVRSWKSAWREAIRRPVDISLPYREKGLLFPDDLEASAFHFAANRGENIWVNISSSVNIFAEIYRKNDTGKPLAYIAENDTSFQVEINSSGSYLLVIQPELLASGNYTLTIRNEASLGFPVLGKNSYNIKSFWGVMRDGGKRQHEGVDIFAPKGTPVLAVAPGIARASGNRLGGKVVWHRSDKGQNFYYAHLDSQAVTHRRVNTGDTLGFVGNTGNAKYTPPHLHFGIYLRGRGAVDPFPYIDNVRPEVPHVRATTNETIRMARISALGANFRNTPSTTSDPDTILFHNTVVAIRSATLDWYRVSLPDGQNGFVHSSLIDSLQLTRDVLPDSSYIAYTNPWSREKMSDSVVFQDSPDIYGNYDAHYLIRHPAGKFLWLKQ